MAAADTPGITVAAAPRKGHTQGVADVPPNRVFLADVRGGDQYLRATWHPESATIVFSHWNGEVCMASTPVALTDCAELIELQVRSLSQVADQWLAPVTVPKSMPKPPGTMDRLRTLVRPKLAEVIDATARFLPNGRSEGRQKIRDFRPH
jgi:hypothetical protein